MTKAMGDLVEITVDPELDVGVGAYSKVEEAGVKGGLGVADDLDWQGTCKDSKSLKVSIPPNIWLTTRILLLRLAIRDGETQEGALSLC